MGSSASVFTLSFKVFFQHRKNFKFLGYNLDPVLIQTCFDPLGLPSCPAALLDDLWLWNKAVILLSWGGRREYIKRLVVFRFYHFTWISGWGCFWRQMVFRKMLKLVSILSGAVLLRKVAQYFQYPVKSSHRQVTHGRCWFKLNSVPLLWFLWKY